MLFLIVLFATTKSSISLTTCNAPKDIESNFIWRTCSGGPIIYHNLSIVDGNYSKIYPLIAIKPFIILANITNTGERYDNLQSTMKVFSWVGWLNCEWHEIPTFGLLDNLVRCNKSFQCPIEPGQQLLTVTIDLSEILFFIQILPDNKPYRIQIEFFNPKKDLHSCIELLSIIKTSS